MSRDDFVIKPKVVGEDGYRVFSIRIRENLVAELDEIAKKTGRSRNELIGMFLDYAVHHYTIEEE